MAMRTSKWSDIKSKHMTPARVGRARAAAEAEILQLNLRELRELAGKSQTDLAEAVDITQSQLSRIERRDDHKLSTIRRYVQALGGDVEVVAVVAGKRVTLLGI